jgi:hypothetical protein
MFNLMADQQLGYVFADMYEKKVGDLDDEDKEKDPDNSLGTDPEVEEAEGGAPEEDSIHR